jgi:Flp pilus assembly pilin Flp
MLKLFTSLIRNGQGTSAVEFALGAPMLAIVVVGIATGWTVGGQVLQMRNAVKVGASYFIQGGSDLDAAETAATTAWEHRPDDGVVEVTRQCTCEEVEHVCTEMCTSTLSLPKMSIRIKATSTARAPILGFVYDELPAVTQEEVVRVR